MLLDPGAFFLAINQAGHSGLQNGRFRNDLGRSPVSSFENNSYQ
jgi:hypothetical protein